MSVSRQSHPLPLRSICLDDPFWAQVQSRICREVIPYQWRALNDEVEGAAKSHCLENFKVAARCIAGEKGGKDCFSGYVFQDSDLYKWIEGASYALLHEHDATLEAQIDEAVDILCSAQLPDGYLNTYYTINGLERRLTNLKDNHELYCLGHLIEAAVAHYNATGKTKLLQAALRCIRFMQLHLGKDKLPGYPGHEIVEMALLRLYELTGEAQYMQFAAYFLDERGTHPLFFEEETRRNGNDFPWKDSYFGYQYYQAAKPVREQDEAQGHAVRAVYLYSAMADLARLNDDDSLRCACAKLWDSITKKRMYITGGIGQSAYGESFTYDFDLPNDSAYNETCASIGLVFFARRMLQMCPNGAYADVMERALYNGILSGMSLDGTSFFYVNPLEVVPEACEKDQMRRHVKVQRQKWFGCACCPPNLARLLLSLEQYICTQGEDTLFFHLYAGGTYHVQMGEEPVEIQVRTDYPWDGHIAFRIRANPGTRFHLALRIPGWCRSWHLHRDGAEAAAACHDGYTYLGPDWAEETELCLDLEMPVVQIQANPLVRQNAGCAAVMRGPVVYCLEEADNGKHLHLLRLPDKAAFNVLWEKDLLNGVVTLTSDGVRETEDWGEALYSERRTAAGTPQKLKWIPYYAWANRGSGEMRVWVRTLEDGLGHTI